MKAELIPIEKIQPNPRQPRTNIDSEGIAELVNSIKDVGVIQPLLVTVRDDDFILVAGSRRFEASKQAKLEEALTIIQLIGTQNLEYRNVAELIGKSKSFVGERLALLNLPDDLKDAVSRGTISMKKADILKAFVFTGIASASSLFLKSFCGIF